MKELKVYRSSKASEEVFFVETPFRAQSLDTAAKNYGNGYSVFSEGMKYQFLPQYAARILSHLEAKFAWTLKDNICVRKTLTLCEDYDLEMDGESERAVTYFGIYLLRQDSIGETWPKLASGITLLEGGYNDDKMFKDSVVEVTLPKKWLVDDEDAEECSLIREQEAFAKIPIFDVSL